MDDLLIVVAEIFGMLLEALPELIIEVLSLGGEDSPAK
jgi:hypothetical protein